jgi:hypothetical protein
MAMCLVFFVFVKSPMQACVPHLKGKIDYLKYIMMPFDVYVCALEYNLTHKKTTMEK